MAFRSFFKRTQPTGAEMDAATLATLQQHGANLTEPRSIMHFLLSPNPEDMERVADLLNADGWNVEVNKVKNLFGLEAERTEIVDASSIANRRKQFEELASSMEHGVYDGWVAHVAG
jgi:hypothetical protein